MDMGEIVQQIRNEHNFGWAELEELAETITEIVKKEKKAY